MEGVEFQQGSLRESCLIEAFYKKKHIEYLQTAAIVLSGDQPDKAIKCLNDYQAALFPWVKEQRARREQIKLKVLDAEKDKRYAITPIMTKKALSKLKELHALKEVGFK